MPSLPADAQQIYDFFVDHGYTPSQAAGIEGNLWGESTLNPESGAGSAHQGLAQWSASRYAAAPETLVTGNPTTDLTNQLDYIVDELRGDYSGANQALLSSTSVDAATAAIFNDYEKPGDNTLPTRQGYANQILTAYGNTTPASSASNATLASWQSDLGNAANNAATTIFPGLGVAEGAAGNLGTIGADLDPRNWLKNGVELVGILAGAALIVLAAWRAAPAAPKQAAETAAALP